MDGWKRMLWAFGLFWLVSFLGGITSLDLATAKAAAVAAVFALIPVVINFLMPFIRQYGIVTDEEGTSLKF